MLVLYEAIKSLLSQVPQTVTDRDSACASLWRDPDSARRGVAVLELAFSLSQVCIFVWFYSCFEFFLLISLSTRNFD